MSKTVRIVNGIVREIVPASATIPSVEHWYGAVFASECIEAPDDVLQGWVFDQETRTFSEYIETEQTNTSPTIEEKITILEQQASQYDQLIVDLTYSITLLELGVI